MTLSTDLPPRRRFPIAAILVGALVIVAGVAFWSVPAAVVTAGAMMIVGGYATLVLDAAEQRGGTGGPS